MSVEHKTEPQFGVNNTGEIWFEGTDYVVGIKPNDWVNIIGGSDLSTVEKFDLLSAGKGFSPMETALNMGFQDPRQVWVIAERRDLELTKIDTEIRSRLEMIP